MHNEQMLKIAIQKSGRLSEDSIALLKECGIELRNVKDRLRTVSENFPIEVFFLRDDDIPEYVEDGVADLGIVGQNVLAEKNRHVQTIEALGFGKCRLSIALPKSITYEGAATLEGKRIATSYPVIVDGYLKKNNIKASVHEISGSVDLTFSSGFTSSAGFGSGSGSSICSSGAGSSGPPGSMGPVPSSGLPSAIKIPS